MPLSTRQATRSLGTASRFPAAPQETLAAAKTFTAAELDQYNSFALDPGGSARNVDFPAEAGLDGLLCFIANIADGAEDITVRNDAAGTIAVLSQDQVGVFWCDGTTIHGGMMPET